MAQKLYQRQGGNLQGMNIINPPAPDLTAAKNLSVISTEFGRMASDNFTMGQAELINSVIDKAYTTAPDDPKKFDDLITAGLKKGFENIPSEWQDKIKYSIDPKVKATRAKVVNNRLDAEEQKYTQNVLDTADRYTVQAQDANNLIMQSLINGDKESLQVAMAYGAKTAQSLQAIGGAKTAKGSYVIGDKATRNLLLSAQYDKVDTAKRFINNMDLETLKEFDTKTFQDRKGFTKAYGLDEKGYDTLDTYIKQRRKALGDEEKRTITAQNQFNAARMVVDYNEDELSALADSDLPRDFKKNIRKAHKKYDGTINPALSDDSFLTAAVELGKVINDPYPDDDPEHNKKLLDLGVQTLDGINNLAGFGAWSDDKQANMQRSLYESIANQEFANAIRPIYSESAINDVLSQTARQMQSIEDVVTFASDPRSVVKNDFIFAQSPDIQKAVKAHASNVIQETFALAAAGQYDLAQKRIKDGNKEIIRLKYSKVIPEWTFNDLEAKLERKEPALHEINGKIWEFQGYTAKDAVFKQKFN